MITLGEVLWKVQHLFSQHNAKKPIEIRSYLKYLGWDFFLLFQSGQQGYETSIKYFCQHESQFDPATLPEDVDSTLYRELQLCINHIDRISAITPGAADNIARFYGGLLVLLGKTYSKDSRLFDTPAPVAQFMVNALEPQAGERIYDPAAGACGLLVEAYSRGNMSQAIFLGDEIDPDVAALGAMNMALHHMDISNLRCRDALSTNVSTAPTQQYVSYHDSNESGKPVRVEPVDVILTHLPIRHDSRFLEKCMDSLKKDGKGRCAMVVERSVLEGKKRDQIELRKKLFEEYVIQMIVELPPLTFGRDSRETTFLLFFSSGQRKQETLRCKLPVEQGPVEEKDFERVLEIWPQWRDYLAGNSNQPTIEQSESLWVDCYEDMLHAISESKYLDSQSSEHTSFEQSDSLWSNYLLMKQVEPLKKLEPVKPAKKQRPVISYNLIRSYPGIKLATVVSSLLVQDLLQHTKELENAAQKLLDLLQRGEEQI